MSVQQRCTRYDLFDVFFLDMLLQLHLNSKLFVKTKVCINNTLKVTLFVLI